ncbi:bifunctional tetrahydrofolate synthase/dihydrofolate synthase [Aromatoleum petrolei]|uniref:Dihydrofolate synthase/folylpolyglutamate synthase n=1 Tax=Aromatoleum petrolei TaxID=76116 RepID=A0ABX1MUC0_9RHOO|nr:bifunctional tetrahydrofolate synthase/dihydrofolate synthase [Aromatoleum petrolei]NMF88707.1 bifunctional tetrahydrofolate synthase/dihydrofolate synthase [Aromatoleum petrolei]QTQ37871.1 Dihydrofolate synthase/folylpolyglutamate synthase [Aromatoleum petrolei]
MQFPDSLSGCLELLESRHATQIQLGLERVSRVRDALGVRSDAVVITVGGTNGKGSTCAMLEAILLAAGYRVGCYTSPHLLRYNERVRIDGREVEDRILVDAFRAVEEARGHTSLTYFEQGTLAAWWVFCREPLDVVILEVGLGGRLDAVNAIDPDCAIVTGIAMDHMDWLGDTREKIGLEKAGIFRAGRPAICADPMAPATLVDHARAIGAELKLVGQDFGHSGDRTQWAWWSKGGVRRGGLAYPALRGANQLLNASAVLMALETLRQRIPVSMQAVRQGLMLVELPGRFQVLPGKPSVVLDVAHNPQAAGVLSENLSNMGFFPETWAVLGMLADKDVEGVVRLIEDRVDHWMLVSLPGARGLSAERLAERLRSVGVRGDIQLFAEPVEGYEAARQSAGEGDRIVAFGSFLTVADVLAAARAARH